MFQGLFSLSVIVVLTATLNYFKYSGLQFNNRCNLTVSDTTILKGIAILMVVIGHIGTAIPGFRIFTPLGATGVGLFLICSGFGIEKSFQKNGLANFWKKRFVNVWLPYALIELLALPIHIEFGVTNILLDFLLIKPLHPFGWYMRFLFIWYFVFYLSCYINIKKKNALLFIVALIYILCSDSLHAQVSFCFLIGIWMTKTSNLALIIRKSNFVVLLACSICLFIIRDYFKVNLIDIRLAWNIISFFYYSTLILSVLIGYKIFSVKYNYPPYWSGIAWVGLYSYELYLVHGYTYAIIDVNASYSSIILFIVMSIVGTYVYKNVSSFINRLF